MAAARIRRAREGGSRSKKRAAPFAVKSSLISPAALRLDEFLKDALHELKSGKKAASMSTPIIDKMALLRQRRDELNKTLDTRAQALLDRYAEADKKADVAFGRHDAQLTAEENELAEVEAAIGRMSNDVGNLPSSSEQSSKTAE